MKGCGSLARDAHRRLIGRSVVHWEGDARHAGDTWSLWAWGVKGRAQARMISIVSTFVWKGWSFGLGVMAVRWRLIPCFPFLHPPLSISPVRFPRPRSSFMSSRRPSFLPLIARPSFQRALAGCQASIVLERGSSRPGRCVVYDRRRDVDVL